MSNYNKKHGFFKEIHYSKGLIESYRFDNLSTLSLSLKYVFEKLDFLFISSLNKTNNIIGGLPGMNYKGSIMIYFISVFRYLSLREVYQKMTPGSEFLYLLGENNIFPKRSSLSKVTIIVDKQIDTIFRK
jgi:hypothetical protein